MGGGDTFSLTFERDGVQITTLPKQKNRWLHSVIVRCGDQLHEHSQESRLSCSRNIFSVVLFATLSWSASWRRRWMRRRFLYLFVFDRLRALSCNGLRPCQVGRSCTGGDRSFLILPPSCMQLGILDANVWRSCSILRFVTVDNLHRSSKSHVARFLVGSFDIGWVRSWFRGWI